MKKTLIVAATVATIATGFAVFGTAPAQAGGWYGKHWGHVYVPKCKIKYYDPYHGWYYKWVPCHGY